MNQRRFVGLVLVLAIASMARAADWPQWRGPARDGKSEETGLLKKWPEGGPERLWVFEDLGEGYSTVAIARGTLYTTGVEDKTGYVYALSLDGTLKWRMPYGPEWKANYPASRTTPTVDGDDVFVMSGVGHLVCLDAETGKRKWDVQTLNKFRGRNITWGIAESIAVDGERVLCTPGGPDASVVALDRTSGRTVWTSKGHSDLSAYCSPLVLRDENRQIVVTCTSENVIGLDADKGSLLWKFPLRNRYSVHPNTPILCGDQLVITTGYDGRGMMLQLSPDGRRAKTEWTSRELNVHHHGAICVDGHVYGTNHGGKWVCVDVASGRVTCNHGGFGKSGIVYADGMFYAYSERGVVGLVSARPDAFELTGSFRVDLGKKEHWAHPVVCNGTLYIRHGKVLMAYDVRAR
jgi:outer membrane protein assembly factor BamB